MQLGTTLLLLLASALTATAFTNGTLIPPYICDLDDLAKGGPKSLGDVIPLLQEGDAQAKIAAYHHLLTNATGYAAQNLCTAVLDSNNGLYSASHNNFTIHTLGGERLIGLIVWIQDFPHGNTTEPRRIGKITHPGLNMIHYPYKCGQTIVHATALDDDALVKSQSDVIGWRAPRDGVFGGFVQVRGVCVTANGYGKFAVDVSTGGKGAVILRKSGEKEEHD
ncbi:hypothetical protein HK100_008787 [Physocladia obscura]|uniref:Uncharacterized protein n=1 Tax=Physocladia obscura TaxID=109957 RepID=A0AAD5XAG5_9FUNG|nr:hypothetical protein HK100_008787 [Physocladia obscura]